MGEVEVFKVLKESGLTGIMIGALALLVWKVVVPVLQKHQTFMTDLLAASTKKADEQLLVYRADVKETRAEFLGALRMIETDHKENCDRITKQLTVNNDLLGDIKDGLKGADND